MKHLIWICLCCLPARYSTATTIIGKIQDTKGAPLSGVSVSLLYPSDSTLATFAITGKDGAFEVKDAAEAHYILQAAAIGYYTEYKAVDIAPGENYKILPLLILESNVQASDLKEVVISGERVPLRIKGDTVEYNASSFRVKPNAPVEDLLRQLPGVQVDEKGNIKSMGKDVKKVLVDGKDFFGTDPLIATKNLPADAVDKVQTFGKHSDQSEFSGIDDGARDQTINLKLKEGKHKGYFGELKGGTGGTDNIAHFDAGAKIFRFRPESQFAALAMANDINKFGFSFNDYINLNGGMGSLMNNSGQINLDDVPIDFGQPVTGKNTTGAVGLNYSIEPRPKNRFNVNYIGTGLDKSQDDQTYLKTYQPSGVDYVTNSLSQDRRKELSNNLVMKWNNEIGTADQFLFQLSGRLKANRDNNGALSASVIGADTINRFNGLSYNDGLAARLAANASWSHKIRDTNWKMLQNAASFSYQKDRNNYDWTNTTVFPDQGSAIQSNLYQNNTIGALQAGWSTSLTRRLWKNIFLEPSLGLGLENHTLQRRQGNATPVRELVDSLSPDIRNDIYSLGSRLSLRQGNRQQQWNINLESRTLWTSPALKDGEQLRQQYQYLLPALFWRRDLSSDRTVELSYNTSIRVPATNELLPVWYFSSPLSGIRGDIALRPEYSHSIMASYRHFDRFSMSSFFVSINGSYVQHKITTALHITPELGQRAQWINTDHAISLYLNGSYSRPLKPLKLELNLELNESLQSTESPVNDILNSNTAYGHQLGITIGNHKHKEKWNLRIGGNLKVSDVRYSINKEFNNQFSTWTATAFFDWQPHKKWFLALDGNLKYYTARSFAQDIFIPLVSVELTRYVLPLNRGALMLKVFDLLNENRSVIREGFNNRLAEQRSNVLQRYLMLTFTYKLNKIGGGVING